MPASASTIFSDDFNRGVSEYLAGGWTEIESNAVDVSLVERTTTDQMMQLRDDDPLAIASQLGGISTIGYTNVTLSYEWQPTNNTEAGDFLWVEWRNGPAGSWTEIAHHELIGPAAYTSASWNLPDAGGLNDFLFRFRVDVNANNEGAYIDNVSLAGYLATANQVPEPTSLVLFGLGLAGIPFVRRRRTPA